MEKRKKDGSCVRDEITGDGFPENERIFLKNLTRTRLLNASSIDFSMLVLHVVE